MLVQSRRQAGVSIALAVIFSAFAVPASPAGAKGTAPRQAGGTGLPAALTDAIRPLAALVPARLPALRPPTPAPLRILLVSSGVDTAVFPESVRSKISSLDGAADTLGYGTYAASALLQVLDNVRVSSYSVYSGDRFDEGRQRAIFDWTLARAADFDAVLYAVPPSELLDPSTLLMSSIDEAGRNQWAELLTAMGDHPMRTDRDRAAFGIALDADARRIQLAAAPESQQAAAQAWVDAVARWTKAREQLAALGSAGLPVVVPAGDLGPGFQTIFGVANLPEVITVGSFDGMWVSPTSSSGPSLDNRVKPDLIAAGNLTGLLPEGSALARRLPINPKLELDWKADEAVGGLRTRTGSTIPASAVVAAQVATLAAGGVRDAAVIRGALTAAARPLPAVPVWRQGAGLLGRPITAAEVRKRGVIVGSPDLGLEPEPGRSWTSSVRYWRTRATGARTTLTDFAGLAPTGRVAMRRITASSPVKARIANDGVRYSTGMGEEWEAGVYCGYSEISLPSSSSTFDAKVSGDGLPGGAREHLPMCLLNGSEFVMHGFYIHDEPAENLTFALIPDIPEKDTVMSAIPKHLPMDPTHIRLFQQVTNKDGDAILYNVPPGYYRIRQFSDYGSPIVSSVRRASDGRSQSIADDIGENPSYQDVVAFVLAAANWSEDDLKRTFGEDRVAYEKSTGGYLITAGPRKYRIVLNWMKKMPGPAVSSRYVDLIDRDDLEYLTVPVPNSMSKIGDPSTWETAWPLGKDAWLIDGVNAPTLAAPAPDHLAARYNAVAAGLQGKVKPVLGIAQYPFNLTTPNYKIDVSLNFAYELQNAAVVAVVQIGDEVEAGWVLDGGVVRADGDSERGIGGLEIAPAGTSGLASFNFTLFAPGSKEGMLTLVLVPADVLGAAVPLSRLEIEGISMRVDTWTTALWPATLSPAGMGHAFDVVPNVSPRQMNAASCRGKAVGGMRYQECEDWQVFVHSPGTDASTVAVRASGGKDLTSRLRATGGRLFDPRRGVSDFSSAFSQDLVLGDLELGLKLDRAFRTNGRFWEQLALPLRFLRGLEGSLTFEIVDNLAGRRSGAFPHSPGGVRVAPYLPYDVSDGAADLVP